jgi:hypothetical protein
MWSEKHLDEEIDFEQFEKDLEHLKAWIGRKKRSRRSWLYSVLIWAGGDH